MTGTFTFIPITGFTGRVEFVYRICDLGTPIYCDQATVTIDIIKNVTGENTTFATDDAFLGFENGTISGNVLTNDYDPEGDVQHVNIADGSQPAHGTLSINTDGTFTYTPVANYFGPDQFNYEVCDNGAPVACDRGTVYLDILPINHPPVFDLPDLHTSGNIPVTICSPITDPDIGNTFTATICSNPQNGSAGAPTISNDGKSVCIVYTPALNYTGIDSLCVTVCDQKGLCSSSTLGNFRFSYFAGINPPRR